MSERLIAIDWGTTNRRVYLLDGAGTVLHTHRDDMGLLAMQQSEFAKEVATIRARHGDFPVVLAGMVGSTRGWAATPYCACPAGIADLAAALHWVEPGRTAIVPGLSDPQGDVMRGEEVQLLGATASGMAPPDALLCQPGTHCKWARMEQGKIASFSTAMTGELFALLGKHSLLSEFLTGSVEDDEWFRAGVRNGLDGRLMTHLFRVRARSLLGTLPPEGATAFASGVLIGHDVAGESLAKGQVVHILADQHLGQLYATAVTIAGGAPSFIDSHAAFVAGILGIWKATPHA